MNNLDNEARYNINTNTEKNINIGKDISLKYQRYFHSFERFTQSSERIYYLFEQIFYLFERFTNSSERRNIFFFIWPLYAAVILPSRAEMFTILPNINTH